MDTPSVSIIIPVYNAEKYVAEAITSAVNQTYSNKEIIVIDDGSTDNSLQIAKGFESQMVKVYSQQNKGASTTRNNGLNFAKGDYIQFLDADDWLSNNKIEAQINKLACAPGCIGLCGTIYFNDGANPAKLAIKHEWIEEGSNDTVDFITKLYGGALIGPTYGGMIQPNAWLTPRKIIDKAGNWNEELTLDDDGEFFCRVMLAAKGIVYAYDGINYYRKHPASSGNLSAKKDHENLKSALLSNQLKVKHVLALSDNPLARLALSRCLWECCLNSYPKYKVLSKAAEEQARALAPHYHYNPYNNGVKKKIAELFGWKVIRQLQYLKHKS